MTKDILLEYNILKSVKSYRAKEVLSDQDILLDYNTLKGVYQYGAKQILHIFLVY